MIKSQYKSTFFVTTQAYFPSSPNPFSHKGRRGIGLYFKPLSQLGRGVRVREHWAKDKA
jgi:hypothetical protein